MLILSVFCCTPINQYLYLSFCITKRSYVGTVFEVGDVFCFTDFLSVFLFRVRGRVRVKVGVGGGFRVRLRVRASVRAR